MWKSYKQIMNHRQRKRHKNAVKAHQEGRISDPLKFIEVKKQKQSIRQKIRDNKIKREMRRKLRNQRKAGSISDADFESAMKRLK